MALLYPDDNGGEHVEAVQRGVSSAAVSHARNEEESTPVADRTGSIVGGQPLVIANSIPSGEPGVTHGVVEYQLAGMSSERCQVGPGIGVARHCPGVVRFG